MTTRIGDVIQPEIFTAYVQERTTEKSALVQSGIITQLPEFDALASGPSTLVNMPFWNDLTGDSEIMKDDGALTPGKIGSSKDVARKQGRAKAWGANGLSALLSGDDPMGAIADLVADFWVREEQKVLIATLNGAFKATSMSGHIYDVSAELDNKALLSGESTVDAAQLLGDAKDKLTAVAMHSLVETYLVKQKLIDYVEVGANDYGIPIKVAYYMGKRVIVDDAIGKDEMFLFGEGAIGKGDGSHPDIIGTEVDRDALASSGEDFLINRKLFIMHPRGIKWTETDVADVFPTNTELANGTNWERVYQPKEIRVVKHKFKLSI